MIQCARIEETQTHVPMHGANPNRLYLLIVKAGGFFAGRAGKKLGEDVRHNLVRAFSERSAQVVENEDSELKVATAHPRSKCRYLPAATQHSDCGRGLGPKRCRVDGPRAQAFA